MFKLEYIKQSERDSTVAEFVEGWEVNDEAEVLIWEDPETFDGEDYGYIVELTVGDKLYHAEGGGLSEVKEKAVEFVLGFKAGGM